MADAPRTRHGEDVDPISVDPVSKVLLRRDSILEAAGFAAERFLRSPSWRAVLPEVLERLGMAADVIARSPGALQLRYLQTLVEISAEKNSTIIFPLPLELVKVFLEGGRPK